MTSLQRREDVTARQAVERFPVQLSWEPLEELLIDREVWDSTGERYDPRFIFCHPDLLIAAPIASLYYRGLSGLSLKAVAGYVGEVAKIERGSGAARLSRDKAAKINRTYNTFICSIIKNSAAWTLDNGSRTIIATLGITLDGVMRNRIGDVAEQRVRSMVLEFLFENDLIVQPRLTREEILDDFPGQGELPEGVLIKFGSEPDISFSRLTEAGPELLAIVEIKGGTDPAGR